jgi:hypothetical protein
MRDLSVFGEGNLTLRTDGVMLGNLKTQSPLTL